MPDYTRGAEIFHSLTDEDVVTLLKQDPDVLGLVYDLDKQAGILGDPLGDQDTIDLRYFISQQLPHSPCVQVQRSDTGAYEILVGAPLESWPTVREDMESLERCGDLQGWGFWSGVYRCEYDEMERFYFVRED